MDFTPEQIRNVLAYMIILVLSVAVHEWGHAFAADRLGDDTPRRQGRVTLNPVAHADPIGTLLLPFLTAIVNAKNGMIGGFGWGKPVQTIPSRYTRKVSMATGSALVAVAGPLMNVVMALVVGIIHAVLLSQGVIKPGHPINFGLLLAVSMNFSLFIFNMLPIPPILDGGYVLARFTPARFRHWYDKYASYGPFVLLAVLMIPEIGRIVSIPSRFLTSNYYELLGKIF